MSNVWVKDVSWWWYIRHPTAFFKDIRRKIKWSWQRITKGYCESDLYSIDCWFMEIFPAMLREFAETTHTYPCGMFDEDDWGVYLNEIADKIEQAKERDESDPEIDYQIEFERQKESINVAFDMLKPVFFSLWD